ncbi:MAG: MmcB family DNA repair protein [Minwuia sp.]|nr:MmcB family DNA repair protein [Minwuia sp.]
MFPNVPIRPDGVAIARGVVRMLAQHDRPALTEVTLRNSRRADVMAIGRDGTVWIVEVKSSVPDYRSDAKWQEYRDFCDRFFFAVPPDFPAEIIPDDCGLIIADTYDGAIVREAPDLKLNAARRKAVTLRFARMAAERLTRLNLEMSPV